MPRHPKPVALRQNHERRDLGMVALAGGLPISPPAPSGLLISSRHNWTRFWGSPLAKIVQQDTDLMALERLWSLYDERERCYRGLRKKRIVPGSMGQPVLSPLFRELSALDSAIVILEDRFGLTPLARLKLGVTFGDAARSLADLNADLNDPDGEAADPRLTYRDSDAADARPAGRALDGTQSRPRTG